MSSARRQHPVVGMLRSLAAPAPFVVTLALALQACDDGRTPLGPEAEPVPAPGAGIAPNDAIASLTTADRIVFTSFRNNGQADIYKMDPLGQNLVPLTTSSAYETRPAWSYDNIRVALVRPRPYGPNYYDDIYLVRRDGSDGHWARPTAAPFHITDPSWSPDGTRLLVAVYTTGGPYLAKLDLASGQLSYVTYYASPYSPSVVPGTKPTYDPTGKIIAFVGPTAKTLDRLVNNSLTHLVSADGPIGRPAFSRDGTKIAYSRMLSGTINSEIFVRALADGTTKRLTNDPGFDGEPTWSPDGSKLAFTSTRSGQYQIYTMTASGGSVTRITKTSTKEQGPAWTH